MDKILEIFRGIGNEACEVISSEEDGKKIIGVNPLNQKSLLIDQKIEDIAISKLKDNDVGMILVTEEKGKVELDPKSSGIVVLDPLDGSNNYLKDIPIYCMGISFSETRYSEGVTHSYVKDLARGDEFWAIKGKGAFMNGRKIKTSNQTDLSKCNLAIDYNNILKRFPEILPLVEQIKDIRRVGADILDLCYVANGGYDGFIDTRNRLSVIHICGAKIAEESGAIITNSYGGKIDVELKIDRYLDIICCANGNIYKQIMPLIKRVR